MRCRKVFRGPTSGALFPDDTGQIDACRFGAWLDEIDQFDAAFFRISPVEAHLLDPRQRLILETSWRALLARAGVRPSDIDYLLVNRCRALVMMRQTVAVGCFCPCSPHSARHGRLSREARNPR